MILGGRLVQDLIKQHRQIQEEVRRGVPFPLVAAASASPGEAGGKEQ